MDVVVRNVDIGTVGGFLMFRDVWVFSWEDLNGGGLRIFLRVFFGFGWLNSTVFFMVSLWGWVFL